MNLKLHTEPFYLSITSSRNFTQIDNVKVYKQDGGKDIRSEKHEDNTYTTPRITTECKKIPRQV